MSGFMYGLQADRIVVKTTDPEIHRMLEAATEPGKYIEILGVQWLVMTIETAQPTSGGLFCKARLTRVLHIAEGGK